MNFDSKGSPNKSTKINSLITYLIEVKDNQIWGYMGLTVELDPTIDFKNQNVLVRWVDVYEGFNDKIVVNSLEEFKNNFTILAK